MNKKGLRKHKLSLWMVALILASCLVAPPRVFAASLSMLCGVSSAWSMESCREAVERFELATGHEVRIVQAPADPSQSLAFMSELFAVRSPEPDVVLLDIIWPGMLAEHLADLRTPQLRSKTGLVGGPPVWAGSIDGRQVALPLYLDIGVLFYRRDLLETYGLDAPRTWSDLRRVAGRIMGEQQSRGMPVDGYLFQGRAYEGLVCNIVEWIASLGAPPIVTTEGIRVATPAFKMLMGNASSWIGETAPRSNLLATEVETLRHYTDGNAVFMRHWASTWNELKRTAPEIAAITGVAALPAGQPELQVGALGGLMVAVSTYSREPEAARDLAMHLASLNEQRERFASNELIPPGRELLAELMTSPQSQWLSTVHGLLDNAVIRPAGEAGQGYLELSEQLASTVHAILAGDEEAEAGLDALQQRLERLWGGGKRW
jgi:trehalose/maltose transport system substrate-binding protein